MRIVHLSDLHFGRHDGALAEGLAEEVSRQMPKLVVVSGDFTQVGSAEEFCCRATPLSTSSPVPVFAVPGNHDVPAWNVPLRFADPYRYYRRYIAENLEPLLEFDNIALAGIKNVAAAAAWPELGTWVDQPRTARKSLQARLSCVPAQKIRIVVAHHPLMQPEQSMVCPMRLAKRADLALQTFARLGVKLVLSGHFHMSYVRRQHDGRRRSPGAAACGHSAHPGCASSVYNIDPVAGLS